MYGNSAALAVAVWGPSLIILLTVLIAVWLVLRASKRGLIGGSVSTANFIAPTSRRFDELSIALESATKLNAYNVHAASDPSVHLGSARRFTPLDFQNSVGEIMEHFREGRVVSIDLGKMDGREAARLVDFCSGMTVMDSGWIFRVTDSVIVLTPLT
jgi:hypothetical protein